MTPKPTMVQTTIYLSRPTLAKLDRLREEGKIKGYADFIRDAVRRSLNDNFYWRESSPHD